MVHSWQAIRRHQELCSFCAKLVQERLKHFNSQVIHCSASKELAKALLKHGFASVEARPTNARPEYHGSYMYLCKIIGKCSIYERLPRFHYSPKDVIWIVCKEWWINLTQHMRLFHVKEYLLIPSQCLFCQFDWGGTLQSHFQWRLPLHNVTGHELGYRKLASYWSHDFIVTSEEKTPKYWCPTIHNY